MAITVLNLMERLRTTETGLVTAYIGDAFNEIQELSWENKVEGYINIVSGVEDYNYPADMVQLVSLTINDNGEDSYNDYNWLAEHMGRTFKLYIEDGDGDWITPNISVTNGIELIYTKKGYVFVYNPDGDASVYDHVTTETTAVTKDEIVYVADGVRADYAARYHYYKRLVSDLPSTALSGVDYTDTTYWSDVTEIASPDENSYINCGNDMVRAVEQYVRAKMTDNDDVKMREYRRLRFNSDLSRTISNRLGVGVRVRPPEKPYSLI